MPTATDRCFSVPIAGERFAANSLVSSAEVAEHCLVAEAKAGAEATGVIKAIARTGDGALLDYPYRSHRGRGDRYARNAANWANAFSNTRMAYNFRCRTLSRGRLGEGEPGHRRVSV